VTSTWIDPTDWHRHCIDQFNKLPGDLEEQVNHVIDLLRPAVAGGSGPMYAIGLINHLVDELHRMSVEIATLKGEM
jgi:hypothetical protein